MAVQGGQKPSTRVDSTCRQMDHVAACLVAYRFRCFNTIRLIVFISANVRSVSRLLHSSRTN